MRGFYQKVSSVLQGIVKGKYDIDIELPVWELPPRQEFGDLSSNVAMRLASRLKKDPLSIASEIKVELESSLGSDVEKIEILRPAFINIFLSKDSLVEALNEVLKKKDNFFRHTIKRKVLLEYVSANPTGPLSIAHGRQAVIGSTIANILSFFGNKVTREYYINDAGRQLDLLVTSVQAHLDVKKGQEPKIPEDGYQGEYVKDIAKAYKSKGRGDLKKFVLKFVMNWIKSDLKTAGVDFDTWRSQQDIIDEGQVHKAIEELKKKGLIYTKDDAVWLSATKYGDDKDRVIIKADKELTYFASDIAYHWEKYNRKFDSLINLWGPDHHGYIPRVKASIKALGYDSDILDVLIIQLVTIKSKGRMSKRKGTMVLLADLVDDVGRDTVRFYYLMRKNSSHLEFDVDLAKEASVNNPFYYVQYACARIESIYKKAKKKNINLKYSSYLGEEEELSLIRTLLQFFHCLEKAYYTLESVFIIEYLKNLATALHKFYEQKRVIVEDNNITQARLNLLEATRIVLHCALGLLGIKPVKKM